MKTEIILNRSGVVDANGVVVTKEAWIEVAKKQNWRIEELPDGNINVWASIDVTDSQAESLGLIKPRPVLTREMVDACLEATKSSIVRPPPHQKLRRPHVPQVADTRRTKFRPPLMRRKR